MGLKEDTAVIDALKVLVEKGQAVVFLMLHPQKAILGLCEEISKFGEEKTSYGVKAPSVSVGEKQKPTQSAQEAFLFIDRKHPGTIKINGKIIQLTSKQFKLLVALAEHPGLCVSYREIYAKIWGNEVAVEMQQIAYHKSQLIKKLSTIVSEERAKALVMTIAAEGMVLNLRPVEIHIL